MKLLDAPHLVARAHDQGHALMQALRGEVEDALASRGGGAAGLLDDHGHRVRLVSQAQAAVAVAGTRVRG